jgi:hypothetical protein
MPGGPVVQVQVKLDPLPFGGTGIDVASSVGMRITRKGGNDSIAASAREMRGARPVEKLFTSDGIQESSIVLSHFRDGIALPQRKPAAMVAIAALTISVAALALQILR